MLLIGLVSETLLGVPGAGTQGVEERGPVEIAVSFLSEEVPRWHRENQCFSCHNNGDAARALFVAANAGYDVPNDALQGTLRWLAEPDGWSDNKGEPAFSDETLARVQFASALASGIENGLIDSPDALLRAAEIVASDQQTDGAWALDVSASIGSPATYGTFLTTATALGVLRSADESRFARTIALGEAWIRQVEVVTVMDAAALILALRYSVDDKAVQQRKHCLGIVRRGQASSGGWGAYENSAVEPFDTALVMLALETLRARPDLAAPVFDAPGLADSVQQGRVWLIGKQANEGGWPETTRPAGQLSYAQYISTSGWVTLALLRTAGTRE